MEVRATCTEGAPETTGVFHDLRELQIAEARMTMFKALQELNAEEDADIEIGSMRQCARCAILFTEIRPPGRLDALAHASAARGAMICPRRSEHVGQLFFWSTANPRSFGLRYDIGNCRRGKECSSRPDGQRP